MIGLCIGLSATAQQMGIVRTLERPGKPSEYLSGVTINVLEYPNAIVSKKGGKFSFAINGKRQGESFTVSRVQKKGYALVDKQLKGRRFAYSSSVPIEIVMVSDAQLENDKKRIEDMAYNKAKKNYDQKVSALEKQLNQKTISEREYRAKCEELSSNYNNYVQLIDQMAERYATTDYMGMSEISREAQEAIENADLERADSLINAKGDFDKREQELLNKVQLKEKSEKLSKQLQEDIDKESEDLVRDYYNKYSINAAAYRNDSAAYYLERIVRLYPNEVEALMETAYFIDKYLADYPRALNYYQQAFDQSKEQYGEINRLTGLCSEKIGLTFDELGDLEKALEWHHKALDIYEKMDEPDSARIAMSYTLIGRVYCKKSENDIALEYTLKGLGIRERISEQTTLEQNERIQNYGDLAQSYNNLGVIYTDLNDLNKALEYHLKALDLREKHLDEADVAFSCSNISLVYRDMGDYDKALEYNQRALEIYNRVLGPAHPLTITLFSGNANIYYQRNEYEKALECMQQALKGSEQYYGPDHTYTQAFQESISYIQQMIENKQP